MIVDRRETIKPRRNRCNPWYNRCVKSLRSTIRRQRDRVSEREMACGWYCYKDVLPFIGVVIVESINVGLNILFKAATLKGMSFYVFIVYSYVLATLLLLPFFVFFQRSAMLPPFSFSLFFKICLLGIIGSLTEILGYAGVDYSSPTLASALSNLIPAFTFILAIIFRMEKLILRSSSSQAKIMGTVVSISGAFAVTLFKGPPITWTLSPSKSLHLPHNLSQSNWSIGGLFLAAEYLLVPMWYIVQANIMKEYPVDLVVVFLYNLCATVMCAAVALVAERNSSAWRLRADISLVAIVYSGLFGFFVSTAILTWALRLKGPVYVSLFKPLSIAIAAAMGVMFLGDTLHLGSVVGAIIICIGFYAVMWGKAKEETMEGSGVDSLDQSSTQKTALLQHNIGEKLPK